ncbi:MAG: hypothetical protein ABI824_14440, partial [Acidobacteriota bacterium]
MLPKVDTAALTPEILAPEGQATAVSSETELAMVAKPETERVIALLASSQLAPTALASIAEFTHSTHGNLLMLEPVASQSFLLGALEAFESLAGNASLTPDAEDKRAEEQVTEAASSEIEAQEVVPTVESEPILASAASSGLVTAPTDVPTDVPKLVSEVAAPAVAVRPTEPPVALVIAKPPMRTPEASTLASSAELHRASVALLDEAAAEPRSSALWPLREGRAVASRNLPLASLRDYSEEAASRMKMAEPGAAIPKGSDDSGAELPGPMLPRELTSLANAGIKRPTTYIDNNPVVRAAVAKQGRSGGWMVSFTVAAVLLAGVLTLAIYAMPGFASSSTPKVAELPPAPASAIKAVSKPPKPAHPLQPFVEVTGFRVVTEKGKTPELHYLVVNHSSAALLNVTVHVKLEAAVEGADAAPITAFSFAIPELAAYRSKDMVSLIES